ncbi:hypothetical protein [Paraburkholderia hayleyella]|uniref:hypothetical protein n=1 Tax=Paraburkholderia hayleyella TaxID=2152889 RepID=UPI001291DE3D|nr:hypothetical protein [Paraburkholderia hayleyella]
MTALNATGTAAATRATATLNLFIGQNVFGDESTQATGKKMFNGQVVQLAPTNSESSLSKHATLQFSEKSPASSLDPHPENTTPRAVTARQNEAQHVAGSGSDSDSLPAPASEQPDETRHHITLQNPCQTISFAGQDNPPESGRANLSPVSEQANKQPTNEKENVSDPATQPHIYAQQGFFYHRGTLLPLLRRLAQAILPSSLSRRLGLPLDLNDRPGEFFAPTRPSVPQRPGVPVSSSSSAPAQTSRPHRQTFDGLQQLELNMQRLCRDASLGISDDAQLELMHLVTKFNKQLGGTNGNGKLLSTIKGSTLYQTVFAFTSLITPAERSAINQSMQNFNDALQKYLDVRDSYPERADRMSPEFITKENQFLEQLDDLQNELDSIIEATMVNREENRTRQFQRGAEIASILYDIVTNVLTFISRALPPLAGLGIAVKVTNYVGNSLFATGIIAGSINTSSKKVRNRAETVSRLSLGLRQVIRAEIPTANSGDKYLRKRVQNGSIKTFESFREYKEKSKNGANPQALNQMLRAIGNDILDKGLEERILRKCNLTNPTSRFGKFVARTIRGIPLFEKRRQSDQALINEMLEIMAQVAAGQAPDDKYFAVVRKLREKARESMPSKSKLSWVFSGRISGSMIAEKALQLLLAAGSSTALMLSLLAVAPLGPFGLILFGVQLVAGIANVVVQSHRKHNTAYASGFDDLADFMLNTHGVTAEKRTEFALAHKSWREDEKEALKQALDAANSKPLETLETLETLEKPEKKVALRSQAARYVSSRR